MVQHRSPFSGRQVDRVSGVGGRFPERAAITLEHFVLLHLFIVLLSGPVVRCVTRAAASSPRARKKHHCQFRGIVCKLTGNFFAREYQYWSRFKRCCPFRNDGVHCTVAAEEGRNPWRQSVVLQIRPSDLSTSRVLLFNGIHYSARRSVTATTVMHLGVRASIQHNLPISTRDICVLSYTAPLLSPTPLTAAKIARFASPPSRETHANPPGFSPPTWPHSSAALITWCGAY